MTRIPLSLALLGFLALPALAAGWSSYENTFPSLPCQDGWAACVVNGVETGPGAMRDAAGHPLPADARIGWFDLKPTANLSPFATLSVYKGPVGGTVAPPPAAPVAANPEPATTAGSGTAPVAVASNPSGNASSPPVAATPNPGSTVTPPVSSGTPMHPGATSTSGNTTPTAYATTTPASTPTTTPATTATSTPTAPPTGGSMRPGAPSAVAATGTTPPATTPTTLSTTTTSPPMPVSSNPPPATTPVANVSPVASSAGDNSCDDLVKLEPAAMMGQLSTGQAKCLDGRVGTEAQQTTKDKISRLLITNAEAKGDKAEWERLMKRHLEDIDRSDPDLCFKYALQLSRGGVGRAQGVIRWADYALENKAKWSGTTYKTRVFNLYKLRAEAANKLWQDADTDYMTKDHTDENEAKATKFRGTAKDYAREWLDYAKASEQDTKTAMALCVSASGNPAFCEGG